MAPDAALVGGDSFLIERALAEGAVLANYDSDTYKSDRVDRSLDAVQIVSDGRMQLAGSRRESLIADAQNFARTLVNEPGNYLTPTILGQRAAEMAKAAG